MLTSSAGGMSLLDELIACVHYRILLCMDEGALSSLSAPIKAGPIWQGLEDEPPKE